MMNYTFADCWNLTSLNLSSFNTSNVKYMDHMFYNDYSLSLLNLSTFHTNKVINMDYMFANCYNLTSLDISNFNSSMASIDNIFTNSTKIKIIISKDENICEYKPLYADCYLEKIDN